jgi:hypothetical protein
MKTRTFASIAIAGAVLLALVSGCKESGPSTQIYVKKAAGQRLRIAVLPFDNVSREQDAGRIVTTTVITYLLSTGDFDVVEPGVVYNALTSEAVRLTEGITLDTCQKLQPKLNADAFIIGLVEEFGEVRIGPDSYPAISFSARLVDARTAEILWAATISKTGAEGVKIFDIGRISSLGKLSKLAVKAMADSLAKYRQEIALSMNLPAEPRTLIQAASGDAASISPAGTAPGESRASTASGATPKYLDESAVYGQAELTALLKDVGSAKLGNVVHKKHYHDTVETQYTLEGGKAVEVRLVDYQKTASAEKFLQHYHPGSQQGAFESLPAFSGESEFGYHHLDMAVGRFGLFLRGPKDSKADIEALAKGLIASLK